MFLDPIQILVAFVIVLLTIILFIIGIQVFKILKELKITFSKINKILDDTGRITESVAEPIEEASDFVMGLKKGVEFFDTVSSFFRKRKEKKAEKKEQKEKVEEAEEVEEETKAKKPKKRRFFTRRGKSLGK